VAQVPSGEAFTNEQFRDIERVIASASASTGLHFSVYVGAVEGDIRDAAEAKHAELGDQASDGVLIMVAPTDRLLEIVTGAGSARRLSDRACALAALSMTTAFAGGDLPGGIVTGVRMLADASGRPIAVH
jgi:uncharacterized membrane protein YgcG